MGNAETLTSPTSNSKFHKYQTSDQSVIVHMNIYSKSNQLTPWLALQSHRQHIYNHPIAFNSEVYKIIEDGICNQTCEVLFKGQKFTSCLFDEINKRKLIGRYYQHQQIWYMLLMLVQLTIFVHDKGFKNMVGNIHPKNILIGDDGKIKIITLNSFPNQKNHYDVFKQQGILSAFISPELIGFTLSKENIYHRFPECVNRHISQTFTIGMTLLSMCLLETNLSNLYDLSFYFHDPPSKTGKQNIRKQIKNSIHYAHNYDQLLNQKIIDFYIKQIQQRYCNLLGTVIKALLNPNPNLRQSLKNLFKQILEPNSGYIIGMELFWLGTDYSQYTDQQSSNNQGSSEIQYQAQSHLY